MGKNQYGAFRQNNNTKPCPVCAGTKGSVMTGAQAKFNSVSQLTGKQICTACWVDESKELIINKVVK